MAKDSADKNKSKGSDEKTLKGRFNSLHGGSKGDLITRCQDYARWTLPYLFPMSGSKDSEMQGSVDSTGARAVNYLSNKLVMTMFAPHQPFFRLTVSMQIIKELQAEADKGDADAQHILATLDKTLAEAEKQAMEELNYNKYRTEATTAAKLLIVTGNALLYHPMNDSGKVQCYSVMDYCIVRDLSGNMIELITRDKKSAKTFKPEVIAALRASDKTDYDNDDSDCTLYTQIKLNEDGKFYLRQDIETIRLDSEGSWPGEELPWIPLTWNLVRGEDYGRGLVEDYAGAFHAVNVLTDATIDVAGIAADIKFFVDPASAIDVKELNDSDSGTYHSGKPTDVGTLQINKMNDLQIVVAEIQRHVKDIAAAFLMSSGTTRNAERVTAEEIKRDAQDLELSHGGIYSRFAEEWQLKTAILLLKKVGVKIAGRTLIPTIITGLDSLSRAGDLDNLRLFVSDMALLNELPPFMQSAINPTKFAQFVGVRRGVDYEKFTFTEAEMQQRQQAAMQQQAQLDAHQQNNAAVGAVAQEAGKAAIKGE